MALSSEEARVLACLIEKEAMVPDSYPLTLNALRLACNQSTSRHPIVAYEDRTVEAALLSLKSIGLVRFVHPSHGGRTIRYRHIAGERWHLERDELAVLAVLTLRGPQTTAEIRARAERMLGPDSNTVEEILDTLAARGPEPFAVHLERRPGERDARWAHLLCGEVDDVEPAPRAADAPAPAAPAGSPDRLAAVAADVADVRRRLDRLESLLGVDDDPDDEAEGGSDDRFG